MKIAIYSGDAFGGAARAAYRLHRALSETESIESTMIVRRKMDDDWKVDVPGGSKFSVSVANFLSSIEGSLARSLGGSSLVPRSVSWTSAINASEINRSDADLINLHWVCAGFLSIEEIAKITKPVVWTLHDMWPFCGAEHIADDGPHTRWREGYKKENRSSLEHGFDVDRWVWQRKMKAWERPMNIVAPSEWLADCARSSILMRDWNVGAIPNALDLKMFKPINKGLAREVLGFPLGIKLILFGAIRGTQLPHKGWDLLQPALKEVARTLSNVEAVIFGQGEPRDPPVLGLPVRWLGHLHDDATLALLYSAADVVVIPSRCENLPQIGTEAQACGCPVVGFRTTGLGDVVEHGVTGFLAEPYDSVDLANGILWVLESDERSSGLSARARERAISKWAPEVVVPQYLKVFRRAIDEKN